MRILHILLLLAVLPLVLQAQNTRPKRRGWNNSGGVFPPPVVRPGAVSSIQKTPSQTPDPFAEARNLFTVDPRAAEWATNALAITKAADAARKKGDFLEAERLAIRFIYGETIRKTKDAQKLAQEQLDQLKKGRDKIEEKLKIQREFQNQSNIRDLESARSGIEKAISKQEKVVAEDFSIEFTRQLSSGLGSGFSGEFGGEYGAASDMGYYRLLVRLLVCSLYFSSDIQSSMNYTVRSISEWRTRLAERVTKGVTPETREKMLQLNNKLKNIEDAFRNNQIRQGQDAALELWNELLR